MAKKPILQAVDAGNNIVEDADCGLSVEPENVEAIANGIMELKFMAPCQLEKMGKNGYEYVMKYHTYDVLN